MRGIGMGAGRAPARRRRANGDALLNAALALKPVRLEDFMDGTTFFSDMALTTLAVLGGPVRAVRDKSGNGHHRIAPSDAQAGILRKIGDLYYIESDGIDDYMVTIGNVNLAGTDAVTLCLGIRKLHDSSIGIVYESSSTMANNGTFSIQAPNPAASINFRAGSRGTVTADAVSDPLPAPATRVATLLTDISAPSLTLRLNGTPVRAPTTTSQGTGSFSNTPHYTWMRGGTSFPAKVYDFGSALYASLLSGDDLAAVEAFVTSRTPLPVSQPSGFSWSGGPEIWTSGGHYASPFDIDAMRPATSVVYHVDQVAGSDSNSGLTEGAPRQKLSTTMLLASAGGVPARIRCKPGVYRGDFGWFGAAPTVDIIVEPWADDPTDPANRLWFIMPALPDPWVYYQGDCYRCTGSYGSDPWAVFDQKLTDARGFPLKYEKAASLADCSTSVGTWWRETTGAFANRLFIHPFDKRDLRALFLAGQPHQIEICTTGGGNNVRFDATTNLTVWMQNVCVLDGSNNVWIKDASPGLTINVYLKDVLAVGGVLGDGMSFHALNAGSRVNAYLKRCGAGYNLSDGFDYRADPAVPTASVFALEDECFTARNGYNSSGANNASTAHGQSTVISLNCDFEGSQNRVVNDIESSKRWMIGCAINASLQTDSTAVTVQAGSASGSHTTKIWLLDCWVAESEAAAIHAEPGCSVLYRETPILGLTIAGGGTVDPY